MENGKCKERKNGSGKLDSSEDVPVKIFQGVEGIYSKPPTSAKLEI